MIYKLPKHYFLRFIWEPEVTSDWKDFLDNMSYIRQNFIL